MQADLNSLLLAFAGVSLAVNAWFLRGVYAEIRGLTKEQVHHGNRLTWLEARTNGTPRRRAHERSGEHDTQPEGA